MILQSTRLMSFLAWVFYSFVWNNNKSNQSFFFLFFSIALESENCDITKDDLNEYINNSNPDRTFFEQITDFGLGTSIIGLINFVMAYIFITCLNHAAECQAHRIRGLFFKSILRQDIGWYDTHQTNDFAARMAEDLNKLQEGIGEKIGMFIFFMTIFSASLINAFYHGWELTLVSTYFLRFNYFFCTIIDEKMALVKFAFYAMDFFYESR